MRRFLKVTSVVAASVLVVGVALYLTIWLVYFKNACDRMEQSLLPPDSQGRSVIYTFQACTTVGTTTEAWVDLRTATDHSVHIFHFVPWGGEVGAKEPFDPSAAWTGSNELKITIGTVGRVLDRKEQVGGVHVLYEIGSELSPR